MTLPIPEFFDEVHAETWEYEPSAERLASAAAPWARRHGIDASGRDARRTVLLLVDFQRDFCHPSGSLWVGGRDGRGAVEDSVRISSFIYRNLASISEIVCSMDSHRPHQIFFPAFWRTREGLLPESSREVVADDIRSGRLRPSPEVARWIAPQGAKWLQRHLESYCEALEARGRHRLFLWPPHCLLGSGGHGLVGLVQEARLFHAFVRETDAPVWRKGLDPLTESYSVLRPEVEWAFDGSPLSSHGDGLLRRLLEADRVVIAGEAASHCVRSTLLDLVEILHERRPQLLSEVFVLEDCMSAVVLREGGEIVADFTGAADEALAACRRAGVRVVQSTDPMEAW